MNKNHRSLSEKTQNKLIAVIMLIIMIMLTSTFLGYKFVVSEMKDANQNSVESMWDTEFNKVLLLIDDLYSESYTHITPIAKNIEEDIREAYNNDMNKLKIELDNNNYLNLSKIISKSIKGKYLLGINNDSNDIFVATTKSIICDFSYDTAGSKDEDRSWSRFISTSSNPELARECANALLIKQGGIIFYEYGPALENHKLIQTMDINSLKEIIINEGLDGLKNYRFLVPTYITDDGDIFGQKDIVAGIRYNNYKLIIIQEFNLYDQIKENYPDKFNFSYIQSIQDRQTRNITLLYIIGIFITIVLILSFVQICNLFNRYLESKKKENEVNNR